MVMVIRYQGHGIHIVYHHDDFQRVVHRERSETVSYRLPVSPLDFSSPDLRIGIVHQIEERLEEKEEHRNSNKSKVSKDQKKKNRCSQFWSSFWDETWVPDNTGEGLGDAQKEGVWLMSREHLPPAFRPPWRKETVQNAMSLCRCA